MLSKCVLTVFLLATLHPFQAAAQQCINPNEDYSDCGNLCEDTCANICEPPLYQVFSLFNPSNPDCVPGCYCARGYIRDDNGDCVDNLPGVCSKDRCGVISANSVYIRCAPAIASTCFKKSVTIIRPRGYTSRCTCIPGYSLDSQRKCIPTNSRSCRRQASLSLPILFSQTTYDC